MRNKTSLPSINVQEKIIFAFNDNYCAVEGKPVTYLSSDVPIVILIAAGESHFQQEKSHACSPKTLS
jgi:hypothetical protein